MYKPATLFIGLRYVHRYSLSCFDYLSSWLSIIGISLGVLSLVTVLSVMNGFEYKLQSDILGLTPQAIISSIHNGSINPQQLPKEKIKLKGIIHIAPITTGEVIIQSAHNVAMGTMLGINPTQKDPLTQYIINTNQSNLIQGKYNIILGYQLAKQLNVNKGDKLRITVLNFNQFTPLGYLPFQRLFNVIGNFIVNSEVEDYQVLVNIQDASCLMHYPIGNITGWRLWLKKPLEVNKFSQQKLPKSTKWQDWRENKGELFQAVRMEKNTMKMLLSLIIFIAILNLINSLKLIITEKKSEISILQMQGFKTYQIMTLFLIYGTNISIIGIILGIIFGILFSSYINKILMILNILPAGIVLPVIIKTSQIVFIILIILVVSLLSIIYPSWRFTTIQPANILRYE